MAMAEGGGRPVGARASSPGIASRSLEVSVMTALLERDGELAALQTTVTNAAARHGSVALVAGEAGIGKSSLVEAWRRDPGADARMLVGWCDDFLTSRTLGPLRDIARETGGALADAVGSLDTTAVFDALLAELEHPLRPTVLVIEDVHWADEATLDVVRYVGRRVERLPAVLALTYRDDELDPDHPLHGVLGALRGPVHRLVPHPLSPAAVSRLTAGLHLDGDEVWRLTGGNPFFVTEVANGSSDLPASVADAVRRRVQTLPAGARAAVEVLSVIPGGATHALVGDLGLPVDDLAAAEMRGVLVVDERTIRFRHELSRLAVIGSLPVSTRIVHHRTVLDRLLKGDDEAAILHHAVEAGRGEVVAEHGPRAASAAYRAGAYRQAAAHQGHVLAYAHELSPAVRAALLEERAWTLSNLHRFDEAVEAATAAVTCRQQLQDPVAHGRALIVASHMHYNANDLQAAVTSAEEAVALLEQYGDEEHQVEGLVARAMAYALLEEPADLALELTERAVEVTRDLGRPDLRSLALNYRAVAQCAGGGQPDPADFREAIRLAFDSGELELAARAYTNLSFELLLSNEPSQRAMPVLDEALAFVEDHDFVSHAFDIRARKATVVFSLGRWEQAERELRELRASSDQRGVIDLIALEGLARLALRRGDPDAEHLVDTAWFLAERSGAPPYMGLIGAIRVEQAWLEGESHRVPARLAELPLARLRPRLRAEILRYAQLAGVPIEVSAEISEPWASAIRGDWSAAAEAWRADQRPYELAIELLASGEVEPTLEALGLLERLGAEPAARLARRQLRSLGVRHIPRGPQPLTRRHPAGLTERQAEVLDLLVEGLTNAQIADRLVVSVRTVDHHVGAILQKLEVTSRQEAAARAASLTLDPGWR
jgi:DNA-binding CsgD family transcriptional regulator/tetratricopeptide (TPR) repeat protein